MSTSNWPHGTDMGGPNWSLRAPRKSKYDGMGGWAEDSWRIPKKAWLGGAAVVALLFALAYVGSWAGF